MRPEYERYGGGCPKGCPKRAADCHVSCESYAADVILGVLIKSEKKRNAEVAEALWARENRLDEIGRKKRRK